jgi:hypothetical protein
MNVSLVAELRVYFASIVSKRVRSESLLEPDALAIKSDHVRNCVMKYNLALLGV